MTPLKARWKRPLTLFAAATVLGLAAWAAPGWLYGPMVESYPVTDGPLLANVVATARVQTPARVMVGSEIVGTVTERLVGDGDRVGVGDLLLRLRADEAEARLRETQAALAQLLERDRPASAAALREAQARLAQSKREATRQRDLAASGLVPIEQRERADEALAIARAQVERAAVLARAAAPGGSDELLLTERVQTAKAQLAKSEIRALTAGIVLRRMVEPGDVVSAGRALLEIARDGAIELVAQVDERNLGALALGQRALASADAFANQRFDAQVQFIAPGVDAQTGTVEVRLRVVAPPDYLRQDMTVSVDVEVGRRERTLSIPADALRDPEGDRAVVHVAREGRVVAVPVQVGLRGLGQVEITAGLSAADAVLPGSAQAAPGARVRVRR